MTCCYPRWHERSCLGNFSHVEPTAQHSRPLSLAKFFFFNNGLKCHLLWEVLWDPLNWVNSSSHKIKYIVVKQAPSIIVTVAQLQWILQSLNSILISSKIRYNWFQEGLLFYVLINYSTSCIRRYILILKSSKYKKSFFWITETEYYLQIRKSRHRKV